MVANAMRGRHVQPGGNSQRRCDSARVYGALSDDAALLIADRDAARVRA